jgi:hypothetical protein
MLVKTDSGKLYVNENFEHSLESLQEFVGGYIEAIRITDSIVIWVNEEGKLNGLPANFFLTDETGIRLDLVVGNALITGSNGEGDTVSLTHEEVEEVKERFLNRTHFNIR